MSCNSLLTLPLQHRRPLPLLGWSASPTDRCPVSPVPFLFVPTDVGLSFHFASGARQDHGRIRPSHDTERNPPSQLLLASQTHSLLRPVSDPIAASTWRRLPSLHLARAVQDLTFYRRATVPTVRKPLPPFAPRPPSHHWPTDVSGVSISSGPTAVTAIWPT
ncbi:hypothetical protein CDD83_3278 [Cordyceps sp. RAO-2017]|nr:hypothetical protein CDD83_3278 [Cordyceps sp. RAO-2017]